MSKWRVRPWGLSGPEPNTEAGEVEGGSGGEVGGVDVEVEVQALGIVGAAAATAGGALVDSAGCLRGDVGGGVAFERHGYLHELQISRMETPKRSAFSGPMPAMI